MTPAKSHTVISFAYILLLKKCQLAKTSIIEVVKYFPALTQKIENLDVRGHEEKRR